MQGILSLSWRFIHFFVAGDNLTDLSSDSAFDLIEIMCIKHSAYLGGGKHWVFAKMPKLYRSNGW